MAYPGTPSVGGNRFPGRGPRTPQKIGDILGAYLEKSGFNEVRSTQRMARAWKAAVPEKALRGTRLVRITDGIVHVGVTSSALMYELKGFYGQEILDRLRKSDIGYVRELRFKMESVEKE